MDRLQDFRLKLYFEFFEALEEKQKEIEDWALEQFAQRGQCTFDFGSTDLLDKEIVFKSQWAELSASYLRPLKFLFREYTSKFVKNEDNDMPLYITFMPCY